MDTKDLLPIEVIAQFTETAPVDVDGLAKALGLRVGLDASLGPEISGKIVKDPRGGPAGYSIYINANDVPRRQRFTLAHEIAHYVLHRDLIGDGIEDNALYRSKLGEWYERQANRMAADILLPPGLVRRRWASGVKEVSKLADAFNVSEQAMRIRLDELGLRAEAAPSLL